MSEDLGPNPNTPKAWDSLWKGIGLSQAKDVWIQARLEIVATLIPEGVSVIDLAAGPGFIRHRLSPHSLYTPVDFSPESLKLCEVPGILAPCTEVPVPDDSYHTVLCMEILEHLDDLRPLILEAVRIATFQVIVTVPDNRLPPEQFNMHRRTWDQGQFTDFLQTFPQFAHVTFFQAPANIIGQCVLKTEDHRP